MNRLSCLYLVAAVVLSPFPLQSQEPERPLGDVAREVRRARVTSKSTASARSLTNEDLSQGQETAGENVPGKPRQSSATGAADGDASAVSAPSPASGTASPLDATRVLIDHVAPYGTQVKIDVRNKTVLGNVQVGFDTVFFTGDPVSLRKALVCAEDYGYLTRADIPCVYGLTLTSIEIEGTTYEVTTNAAVPSASLYSETASFRLLKPVTIRR